MSDKTGLCFFPAFDWAISPTHPEREERLLYTRDQIFEEGLMDLPNIREYKPRLATFKDIARVHFCIPGIRNLVTDAHLIAAGGALVMADALMNKEIKNGFALVRPPGHHAMLVAHGNRGFCNINNEAIMVEYLRQKYGIRRVAIIDTDVHHGDGTQDIYYNDPDVLFVSFHQDGRTLYPGSGFPQELGGPLAMGKTINIPLPPGTTDEGLHYVLDNLILKVLKDFKPQIIVNSAGQDNHYTDPLANMKITAQGYAALNEKLKPDIAVLEGGYAIESALPYVNTGIILAMAGLDYSYVREPDLSRQSFQMSSDKWDYIRKLVAQLNEVWEHRNKLAWEQIYGNGPFYQHNKSVYYDTSNIQEEQVEKIRLCRYCTGFVTIDTYGAYPGGKRIHAYCISVSRGACKSCQQEARDEFEAKIKGGTYDYIYLQDKVNDRFYTFDRARKTTTEVE